MRKSQAIWKLKNTFLNILWIKTEIKEGIRKYFKLDQNENTTYQHLKICGTLISRKSMALKTPILEKMEWSQINDLKFHLKHREKQELKLIKLKVTSKKAIINTKVKINEIEKKGKNRKMKLNQKLVLRD